MEPADIIQSPSPNWNHRPAASEDGAPIIDTVILHYTGMKTGKEALDRLCSSEAQVSAHYLVEENGDIYQLVLPEKRAWHAGVSFWQGRNNINDTSIGVEIVNPGHEFGYRKFPDRQIERLVALLEFLKREFDIPTGRFLGHSDVAPNRKQDPGELFPWQRLAQHGFGVWAETHTNYATNINQTSRINADGTALNNLLAAVGYSGLPDDLSGQKVSQPTIDALKAFQRHWRPAKVDGQLDMETEAILLEIADKINS